jgi:hypothetical protein
MNVLLILICIQTPSGHELISTPIEQKPKEKGKPNTINGRPGNLRPIISDEDEVAQSAQQ